MAAKAEKLAAYEASEDQYLWRNWRNFTFEMGVGNVTFPFVKFLLNED